MARHWNSSTLVIEESRLTQPVILGILLSMSLLSGLLAIVAGGSWVFAPWAVGIAVVTLVYPRAGVLILVASWFIKEEILGVSGLYPADVMLALVTIGYVAHRLVTGQKIVEPTSLNWPIVLWMAAYLLSFANWVDYGAGVKNWLRHLELFLLFVAAIGLLDRRTIRRALHVFISICLVISLMNIVEFLRAAGHIRAFGSPKVLFSGFLALAAPMVFSRYLFESRSGARRCWAILFLIFIAAQLANQSRGAMLQLVTGVVFIWLMSIRWSRVWGQPAIRRRLRGLALGFSVAAVLALTVAAPEIGGVLRRYSSQSGNPLYTLQTREFLWMSALEMFTEHPLIGVGPAQTLSRAAYIPGLRLNPMGIRTQGLGIHNTMLRYLAEGGIVGMLLLLILLWRALALGRGIIDGVSDPREAGWQIGLWGMVFVIVTRSIYEGHLFYSVSGITTVFFFATLHNTRRPPRGERMSELEQA